MIVLGAVVPHPPILLPQIGAGQEAAAQATLAAYAAVARRLRELDVQRVLLISTHGIVTLQRFHILSADLQGDFERFGQAALTFERAIDRELVAAITGAARASAEPLTETRIWEQSDHSVGVPLRLLDRALPARIGVVSISFRPPADHFRFGQVIGAALAALPEPTAILASGDAVHRLNDDSPNGRHPRGVEVQEQYETALAHWDHEALFAIDEALRREVDESVISPTLVLMGALQSASERPPRPHILAAEHPWGVGYVTALIAPAPESD